MATVRMLSSEAARKTRMAISPRLATNNLAIFFVWEGMVNERVKDGPTRPAVERVARISITERQTPNRKVKRNASHNELEKYIL